VVGISTDKRPSCSPTQALRAVTSCRWLKDAPTRNALYDAFVNQTLWLELWKANAPMLGTRVRFDIKEYGINPPATCL
jgi:hypothetical protein